MLTKVTLGRDYYGFKYVIPFKCEEDFYSYYKVYPEDEFLGKYKQYLIYDYNDVSLFILDEDGKPVKLIYLEVDIPLTVKEKKYDYSWELLIPENMVDDFNKNLELYNNGDITNDDFLSLYDDYDSEYIMDIIDVFLDI